MASKEMATPPSTPLPSTPLQLSGFLSGDTIEVQGDTHNLQFSVQFNIHHKHNSHNQFHFPPTISLQNQTPLTSNSSSYNTPITTHEDENQIKNGDPLCHEMDWIPNSEQCHETTIVTRLRSGVLSPVKYYGAVRGNLNSWRKGGALRKRGKGKMDVLERVLRRRSFPTRPCNSYSFFVMATWGMVESSSFGETSKKLGKIWCKLPHSDKKVFEDMALKDNTRYKKQCRLLMSRKRLG